MTHRFDSILMLLQRTCLGALGAAALLGQPARAAGPSVTGAPAKVCVTKAPVAMLDGAEPGKHEFHAVPENHATESGTFKDGAQLDIDVSGCQGPQTTKMVIALPAEPVRKKDKRSVEKKNVAQLVTFLAAHQDAFAKTPLGLPGPSRALLAINEGRMSYRPDDKLCFDKDNPVIVPEAQRCARFMTLSWTAAAKRTFTIKYQAEP